MCRCLRFHADAWVFANDRAYFSSGKGRSVTDTVWRGALRDEVPAAKCSKKPVEKERAVAKLDPLDEVSVSVLWDAKHFYDFFKHSCLIGSAVQNAAGQNIRRILRFCLTAYRTPRFVSIAGQISKCIRPSRSIVAGCTFADIWVRIYTMPGLDRLTARHREADIDMYYDDLGLSVRLPRFKAVDAIEALALDARDWLEGELGASISVAKSLLVASCPVVRDQVLRRLGKLAGVASSFAKRLGVDFCAGGRRRGHRTKTTRKKRLQTSIARIKRVKRLIPAAGAKRTMRLFKSGLKPELGFGSEVTGISDKELYAVETCALASLTPSSRGRSREATLLLHGVPSASLAFSAVLRWSREVWEAANGSGGLRRRVSHRIDLAELSAAWETVSANQRARRDKWLGVAGPIGASILELGRLGWSAKSPFIFQTSDGTEIALTMWPPKLLQSLLEDAYASRLAHKVASKDPDGSLNGREFCHEVPCAVLRSKKLSPLQRGIGRAFVANAIWSRQRLADSGRDVALTCSLCGAFADTVWHRLWQCPAPEAVAIRIQTAKPDTIQNALAAGPGSALYSRGRFAYPSDFPAASADPTAKLEIWNGDANGFVSATPAEASNVAITGFSFQDGSAQPSLAKRFCRAGWSIVAYNARTLEPTVRIQGVVPHPWPQTSGMAEAISLTALPLFAKLSVRAFQDYKNIIKLWHAPAQKQLAWNCRFAGFFRQTFGYPEGKKAIHSVDKVKAHISRAEAAKGPWTGFLARGNNAADHGAKQAVLLHPQAAESQRQAFAKSAGECGATILLATRILHLWPVVPREELLAAAAKEKRRPREQPPKPETTPHKWAWHGNRWFCLICCGVCAEEGRSRRDRQSCSGVNRWLREVLLAKNGHHIWIGELRSGVAICWCAKCGAWMTKKPTGLIAACPVGFGEAPPTEYGRRCLRKLRGNKHPDKLDDALLNAWPLSAASRLTVEPGTASSQAEAGELNSASSSSGIATASSRFQALRARLAARTLSRESPQALGRDSL